MFDLNVADRVHSSLTPLDSGYCKVTIAGDVSLELEEASEPLASLNFVFGDTLITVNVAGTKDIYILSLNVWGYGDLVHNQGPDVGRCGFEHDGGTYVALGSTSYWAWFVYDAGNGHNLAGMDKCYFQMSA